MKKELKIVFWGLISTLGLSIFVLFLIHVLFKISSPCDFFIPNWTASDVLEYFGVILGISVALISLILANYVSRQQQIDNQKFQLDQELKIKVNEICVGILREFSFPKINIAVDNLLANKNNLNKFYIQEEFNNTFFEIEILFSALKYYFPNNREQLKDVGDILSKRLDAISKLENVFLQGCIDSDLGQHLCTIDEDLIQQYLQESFTYILENTDKLSEELKKVIDIVGERK